MKKEIATKNAPSAIGTNLVKSMDLVELNPELDVNEQTTNLCLEIIDYITARL